MALFIHSTVKVQIKKIPAGRKEDGSETICRADVLTVVPLIYLIIGYCGCCRIQGMLRRVADQCSKGVGVCERCPRHSKGLQIPDVTIPSRGKAALVTWAGLTHLGGLQKSWCSGMGAAPASASCTH